MTFLEPQLTERGFNNVARWVADMTGSTGEAVVRRLNDYRRGVTTTISAVMADALFMAVHGPCDGPMLLRELDHWPTTQAAAEEMVEAEAWIKGVVLETTEGKRLARDLLILANHVIERAVQDSPAALKAREKSKLRSRKKPVRPELMAA